MFCIRTLSNYSCLYSSVSYKYLRRNLSFQEDIDFEFNILSYSSVQIYNDKFLQVHAVT